MKSPAWAPVHIVAQDYGPRRGRGQVIAYRGRGVNRICDRLHQVAVHPECEIAGHALTLPQEKLATNEYPTVAKIADRAYIAKRGPEPLVCRQVRP